MAPKLAYYNLLLLHNVSLSNFTRRYLRTLENDGKQICYELVNITPVFSRRTIRGRGTRCWLVKDEKGKYFLVKGSWHSKNRVPETEFLDKAKGLTGVCQIILSEDGPSVSALRGILPEADPASADSVLWFSNMEAKQFMNFLVITISIMPAGHQNLWGPGILHRDVSINNILIGSESSPIGKRGILIDLDMAIWINRVTSLADADFRTSFLSLAQGKSSVILRSLLLIGYLCFPIYQHPSTF